jgi:SAM-dependent methyltransferase
MELRRYYENAFRETDGAIYGSSAEWSAIQRTGHQRRMAIIDSLDIGEVPKAVAMDFGMGSWGFASVFPRLRKAARCFGVDIAEYALQLSRERDWELGARVEYRQSDGESIPVADGTLDIFWGGEVLEHVVEPRMFLEKVAVACKDGAHVVLSTPNRDAIFYLLRRQCYGVGPEHIALLNLKELLEVSALFFDTLSVHGYETSIAPDVDSLIIDERIAERLQDRARDFPELASGLIFHGKVDAAKASKNRRNWRVIHLPHSSSGVVYSSAPTRLTLAGPEAGMCIPHGGEARFELNAKKYVLFFWSHDWSGSVEVEIDGKATTSDLFSVMAGYRRVETEFDTESPREVVVRRLGRQSVCAKSDQVIFHSAVGLTW